jgi:hypothetical protein
MVVDVARHRRMVGSCHFNLFLEGPLMPRITSELCNAFNSLFGGQSKEPAEHIKTIKRLTAWNKRVAEDLDKMLGTPHDEGSAIDRVVVLGAKLRRLQATVFKLPKCYRLKDGELVRDVPIVPTMRVWRGDNYETDGEMVDSVLYSGARLGVRGEWYCEFTLADSYEAAKRLGAVWVQEK